MVYNESDIAIINMNCRYPGVHSVQEFEKVLRSGRNILDPKVIHAEGYNKITLNNVYDRMAYFDAPFFGYSRAEAEIMDPQHRIFLECAWEIFEQSGYNPQVHDERIGLYAGVSTSFYLLTHLMGNPDKMSQLGGLQIMVGNDKDHLTSQLAYRLNTKGPCVTVQASCATSLVAVHLACESLLSGQCDMALAGGVTFRMEDQRDYDSRGDGLQSEDGLIHTFDADATGTVYSSGLGMVLLKRAVDAQAQGDHIFAVIKGSAINNDGGSRSGYTVPGVDGQVEVMIEAQSLAGVDPQDIQYIELHGSGTPLGDAIEFEAIKRTFEVVNAGDHQWKLGAVKPNIGHVEMASGVSGLIKTVLSLQNKVFYPTLNFRQANPQLGMENTPFEVNTTLQPWLNSGGLRTAGVSAFGLGGTNAHLIVQEPLPDATSHEAKQSAKGPYLITLSAKTPESLSYMENNLLAELTMHQDYRLQDVAYTLRYGRASLPLRKHIVVENLKQLVQKLSSVPVHMVTSLTAINWQLEHRFCLDSDTLLAWLQTSQELSTTITELLGMEVTLASLNQLNQAQRTFISQYLLISLVDRWQPINRSVIGKDDGKYAAEAINGHCSLMQAWQQLNVGQPITSTNSTEFANQRDACTFQLDANQAQGNMVALQILGQLWKLGVNVDWHIIDAVEHAQTSYRIALPGTVFARQRYWVEVERTLVINNASTIEAVPEVSLAEVKATLIDIWQRTLGCPIDSTQASFFEMGGHSLLATTILYDIKQHFNITCPLSAFFADPTIDGLSQYLLGQWQTRGDEPDLPKAVFQPDQQHLPFPLTDVQQAYWVGRRKSMGLGNISTHIYVEYELRGLEQDKFNQALNKVIARHGMLRAIVTDDGLQQILPEVPSYHAQFHVTQNANEFQQLSMSLRETMSHQMIDCSHWPLFEIEGVVDHENKTRLHVSIDLLVADAWSLELFMRELAWFYHHPQETLPKITYSFRDYVLTLKSYEQTPQYERARNYWCERVQTMPPGPRLPLLIDPSELDNPAFARRSHSLSRALWQRLKMQAGQMNITPTTLLLSCFAQVLARFSASQHFTLNLTLFNRLPLHEDINYLVGDFTSLTLLEVNLSEGETLQERAKAIHNRLWNDLDHRLFGGIQVSRLLVQAHRDPAKSVVPIVFTSLLNQDEARWEEGDTLFNQSQDDQYSVSQTPQVWIDHQVMERQGELHFNWDVVEALFDQQLIDQMFQCYCALLKTLATRPQSWNLTQDILGLPSVSAPVEQTPAPTALMHHGLLNQAEITPDITALITAQQTLTYRQLSNAANEVAHALQAQGIKRGDRVVVVMKKGWQQIAAVHGILRLGAAYVPIDPSLPVQRQSLILNESDAGAFVTQLDIELVNPSNLPVVVVTEQMLAAPLTPLVTETADVTDVAYIIFTSGSTGTPKGVMIDHRAAMNTLEDINSRFNVEANDRVFGLSSLSFDLSVYDAFAPFMVGASLVLPDAGHEKDPRHWLDMLDLGDVTVWNSVPALMQMLCEYLSNSAGRCPELRLALLSGDWIPLTLPAQMRSRLNQDMTIISLGGATECAIWSIFYPVDKVEVEWKSIPYGRGLQNQPIYVLNDKLEECPIGVEGEICIGGMGLAQGYLNDPDKTAASFVWCNDNVERIYRTGDLGRYFSDGQVEFLGRKDNQVKVNGFRVELSEIERCIENHQDIEQSVVVAVGSRENKRLIAFAKLYDRDKAHALHEKEAQEQAAVQGIITNPAERLAFKLKELHIRKVNGKALTLPAPTDTAAYIRRRSYRNFIEQKISLNQLGLLLNKLVQVRIPGLPFAKYNYASAGGLYPVQTYIYLHPDKIEEGVFGIYYLNPREGSLMPIAPNVTLNQDFHVGPNRSIAERAAFSIFMIADMAAIQPLYGEEAGWHFSIMEAGTLCQLLEDGAPEYGLGLCQLGMATFTKVAEHFQLSPTHRYIHCTVGGLVGEDAFTQTALLKDFSTYEKSTDSKANAPIDTQAFKDVIMNGLKQQLPDYMLPTNIVLAADFPLNANGKLDRNTLIKQAEQLAHQTAARVQNHEVTELQKQLLALWQDVLGVNQLTVEDDFFSMGGSSIELVRIQQALEQMTAQEIPIVDLFRLPNIIEVSHYIESLQNDSSEPEENNGQSPNISSARGNLALRRKRQTEGSDQ
ncbi:non-ribosomal peptide synthetase [Gilliamella sp. App2-1]|uniref:colibactin hybrid non-ribosomal peptide synthetase/type I polyketide synthase ClbK n=1 Tax=Gilliamella sp. App2-1 TaxID=3120230 RepID=UPI0008277DF6|nr:colibactin hybrid non-ribosomal peptide synthetase/type I polyketide synthase ClbK [Gilliamella apicola]OCG20190.1 non-ribosomal peptide synthetase [Gilliamella apicola]